MDDHAFGEWLVRRGLLTPDELSRTQNAQLGRQGRLDTEILDLQLLSESELLDAVGKFHRSRTVSSAQLEFASPAALRMITSRIATRLGVVPFKLEGKTLSVATLSPGDLLVEDEIAQQTGCMVASFVPLEIRFVEALHRHYEAHITARYAGLIRRLSAMPDKPTPRAKRPPLTDREPVPGRPLVTGHVERAKARPAASKPATEELLEISDEDFDQFPSLRQEAEEETAAPETVADKDVETQPVEGGERDPAAGETVDGEIDPEELLATASLAMQNAEMRDDIGDAVLGFCAPFFNRRMMLVMRRDTIMGWRGEGVGVDEQAVRDVTIPVDEPSVFSGLLQGVEFWLGSLPAMPRNADIVMALGNPRPEDCFIMPVRMKGKVVCFFYGDNGAEGVGGLPIGELKRLSAKASLAFQIYLMKGKIRRM